MKIVGISACPAGLAHTPMAAKALEKAGAKLGYNLKMEQQGSMGQINTISDEEAKECDFVIIASDQKIIGMERFEGKPVIRVNITTCIKAPEAVIKKCSSNTKIKKQFNLAESNCLHKTIMSSVHSHYNTNKKRGKKDEEVF